MNLNDIYCTKHSYFFLDIEEQTFSVLCLLCKKLNYSQDIKYYESTNSTKEESCKSINSSNSQNLSICKSTERCSRKIDFICFDCLDPCCYYCMYLNHKDHDFDVVESSFEKISEKFNNQINNLKEFAKTHINSIDNYEENTKKLIKEAEAFISYKNLSESTITENKLKYSQKIDNFIKQKESQFNNLITNKLSEIKVKKEKIESSQSSIKTFKEFILSLKSNLNKKEINDLISFLVDKKEIAKSFFKYENNSFSEDISKLTKDDNLSLLKESADDIINELKKNKTVIESNLKSNINSGFSFLRRYSKFEKVSSYYSNSSSVNFEVNRSIYLIGIGLCNIHSSKSSVDIKLTIFQNSKNNKVIETEVYSQDLKLKCNDKNPSPVSAYYLSSSIYLRTNFNYTVHIKILGENHYLDCYIGKTNHTKKDAKEDIIIDNSNFDEGVNNEVEFKFRLSNKESDFNEIDCGIISDIFYKQI